VHTWLLRMESHLHADYFQMNLDAVIIISEMQLVIISERVPEVKGRPASSSAMTKLHLGMPW